MLPRVFAVEDDEDGRLSPAGPGGVARARAGEPVDEVLGGGVGGPRRIAEADQVGQRVVAEPARDLRLAAETVPSARQSPTGRRPNSRSWSSAARRNCSAASSGLRNRSRGILEAGCVRR